MSFLDGSVCHKGKPNNPNNQKNKPWISSFFLFKGGFKKGESSIFSINSIPVVGCFCFFSDYLLEVVDCLGGGSFMLESETILLVIDCQRFLFGMSQDEAVSKGTFLVVCVEVLFKRSLNYVNVM